jgi:hypothetical protein
MPQVLHGMKRPNFNMAMNWTVDPYIDIDCNFDISVKENLIQGKMISCQYIVGMADTMRFDSEESFRQHVKNILAKQLAQKIIEDKLAEFTFEKIHSTQSTVVRSRCFITPNDQVRILRTHGGFK